MVVSIVRTRASPLSLCPNISPVESEILSASFDCQDDLLLVCSATASGTTQPSLLYSLCDSGLSGGGGGGPVFLGRIPISATCSKFLGDSDQRSHGATPSTTLLLGYPTPDGPKVAITKLHVSSSFLLSGEDSPFTISLTSVKRLSADAECEPTSIDIQPGGSTLVVVSSITKSSRLFVIVDDVSSGTVSHASFKTCNDVEDEVSSFKFSDTGGHLVSCTRSGSISVFKCGDGKKHQTLYVEKVPGSKTKKAVNVESIFR